jgi:hypothetical protein
MQVIVSHIRVEKRSFDILFTFRSTACCWGDLYPLNAVLSPECGEMLVYSTEVDAKLHLVWKVVNQHIKVLELVNGLD